jgi:hypothetical protein
MIVLRAADRDAGRRAQALELSTGLGVDLPTRKLKEATMGFGKGVLLWLIGIPLPIILLLALFMHH